MNKKKYVLFLLIFTAVIGTSLYTEEPYRGIAISSNVIIESGKSGGAFEVSFPLYSKGAFFIRNAVVLSGFGAGEDGILSAGDKLMLGGYGLNNTASYGFVSGAAGTMISDEYALFESPLIIDVTAGGGFEICTSLRNSFSVEAGGGISIMSGDITGFAHLAAVFNVYLN